MHRGRAGRLKKIELLLHFFAVRPSFITNQTVDIRNMHCALGHVTGCDSGLLPLHHTVLCVCVCVFARTPAAVPVFTAPQRGLQRGQSARPPWLHREPGIGGACQLGFPSPHLPRFVVICHHPLLSRTLHTKQNPHPHERVRRFHRDLVHGALPQHTHARASMRADTQAYKYACIFTPAFLRHAGMHRKKQHHICALRHRPNPTLSQAHMRYLSINHSICSCVHA